MFGVSTRDSRRRCSTSSVPGLAAGPSRGIHRSASVPQLLKENVVNRDTKFPTTPGPVCHGHGMVAIAGRRRQMVNAISAVPGFLTIHSNDVHHFFGVYNGFGGCEAAEFCKNQLHHAIIENVKICVKSNLDITTSGLSSLEWSNVMDSSFSEVRKEINGCFECMKQASNPLFADEVVGSTAVVIVLSLQQIVIANCGDSRAVLSRNGQVIPLANNIKESLKSKVRLRKSGGSQFFNLCSHETCCCCCHKVHTGDVHSTGKKRVVIAEPRVECVQRCKEDEFLILASHGLWDVIDTVVACDVVRMCLVQSKHSAACESGADFAAAFLVKLAFSRGSSDNISVVVVDLQSQ